MIDRNVTRIMPVYQGDDFDEKLALFSDRVPAGFPSPATDYMEGEINLHELLVKTPAATFFAELDGDSMIDRFMLPGDILIIDRSIEATSGKVVMASVNRDFTVKQLQLNPPALIPANLDYDQYVIKDGDEFECFGVVTGLVRREI